MATGGLNTFRENAVYIGMGKQAAWGTDVTPTWFYIWRDGSDANPETKVQTEREGDGTGYMSLSYKQEQHGVVKISEYARPILLGYALQGLLGSGSDTYTAAAQNTTLSSSVAAGATSVSVVANLGNVGTLPMTVEPGYSAANAETVTLDLTTKTGTGPYTYTLAAGATFARAHTNGSAIQSAASHALTGKYAYDVYTIEIGYGEVGNITQVIRYVDCVCVDLQLMADKGKPVSATHTWYAASTKTVATPTATTYPASGIFKFESAAAAWRLNGASTGNAATIEKLQLSLKRSTVADDFQSEGISPVFFLPGNLDISGNVQAIWNSWADYNLAYYGSTSPAAGTKDSNLVGQSALATTFTVDAVSSLALSLPTINYTAAKVKMGLGGKGIRQPITFTAQKTAAQPTPLTFTLSNVQNSAY